MSVIIVGAGIGGLTTALALGQAGIDVHVFESARQIRPLGVGINILPHAMKRLDSLGLLDVLSDAAVPTEELVYFDPSGRQVWSEARGRAAGYLWPQLAIHRGALQRILYEAVCDRLGSQTVSLGCRLEGFHYLKDGGVSARFLDRTDGHHFEFTGECLVGADGIHSVVRSQLYPREEGPRWNGILQCRGTTDAAPFLTGRSYVAVATPTEIFVAYPIRHYPASDTAAALINWVAGFQIGTRHSFPPEEWNRRGESSRILPHFGGWSVPCLDIESIVGNANEIYEFPQVDREPIPRWSFGCVTLLGDAAHPMSPNGSNGASQAILDSFALRDALATDRDVEPALLHYEQSRIPATTNVVLANRRFGMQQVARMTAHPDRQGAGSHDLEAEIRDLMESYRRTAGFDVESVNFDSN